MANPFDQFDASSNPFDKFDTHAPSELETFAKQVSDKAKNLWDKLPSIPTAKSTPARDMMAAAMPILGGSYAPDVAMGGRQVLDAAAQLAARATGLGVADTEATNKNALNQYNANFKPEDMPGSSVARGIGQGVVTGAALPMRAVTSLPAIIGQGAAGGAASGALTPVYDPGNTFVSQKANQAFQGAKAGAIGAGVIGAAGRVLNPQTSPEVQKLIDAGITTTPGQTLGGVYKTAEDKLTSVPLLGDAIKSAQRGTVNEYNKALYKQTLAPLGPEGEAVAAAAPVGREGIAKVGDFLSSKYEELLGKSAPSVVSPEYTAAQAKLTAIVPRNLRQDFTDALDNTINSKITAGNTLPPNAAKDAESEIGKLAKTYLSSSVGSEQVMGQALRQAQSNLRDMIAASNPETGPAIQQVNKGWANLAQLETAGSRIGAKEGIITPAQFMSAVKQGDNSIRDRSFARGQAMNQGFSETAEKVLPNKYPDSGTVGRLLMSGATGGGLGVLGMSNPGVAAGVGAAALPYLPGGRQAMLALLAKRPDLLRKMGDSASSLAPYLGLAAPGLLASP